MWQQAILMVAVLASPASAQVAADSWSDPAAMPSPLANGGGMVALSDGTLLVIPGGGRSEAWLRSPAGAWTPAAATPASVSNGAKLTAIPGARSAYLASGTAFHRFDADGNTWTALPAMPAYTNPLGYSPMAATAAQLFVYGWDYGQMKVFTPDASGGSWASQPANTAGPNAPNMAYPGSGDDLFAVDVYRNPNPKHGIWKYSISGNSWERVGDLPVPTASPDGFGVAAFVAAGPNGTLLVLIGTLMANQGLYLYALDTQAWTLLSGVPVFVKRNATAAWTGGDTIFVAGAQHAGESIDATWGAADLWSYSIAAGKFATPALPELPHGSALSVGALCVSASDLYAVSSIDGPNGSSIARFLRLAPAATSWTEPSAPPFNVGPGVSLAGDGGANIYVLPGTAYHADPLDPTKEEFRGDEFWRYRIALNEWERLPRLPASVGWGGQLVHAGRHGIHAIRGLGLAGNALYPGGEGTTEVFRFDGSAWTVASHLPVGTFSEGAAVACAVGSDDLYFLKGLGVRYNGSTRITSVNTPGFYRYSMTAGTWTPLAEPPGTVDRRSSLLHPGFGREIFAFLGSAEPALWAYSPSTNTWTQKARAPGSPYQGQSLAATTGADPVLYAMQGGRQSKAVWRYRARAGNAAPGVAAQLDQREPSGATLAAGATLASTRVELAAEGSDPDGDAVTVEVEVRKRDVAFSGQATKRSWPGISGRIAALVEDLEERQSYHWQARTVDSLGAATAWVAFGSRPDDPAETDFKTAEPVIPIPESGGSKGECQMSAAARVGAWAGMALGLLLLAKRGRN